MQQNSGKTKYKITYCSETRLTRLQNITKGQQDTQYTKYNVTLQSFRVTAVVVEQQEALHILSVCLYR